MIIKKVKQEVVSGEVKLLYVAPESLIKQDKMKMQEQYTEEMTKRMEEYKKSLSAETENNEVVSNEQPLNIKL